MDGELVFAVEEGHILQSKRAHLMQDVHTLNTRNQKLRKYLHMMKVNMHMAFKQDLTMAVSRHFISKVKYVESLVEESKLKKEWELKNWRTKLDYRKDEVEDFESKCANVSIQIDEFLEKNQELQQQYAVLKTPKKSQADLCGDESRIGKKYLIDKAFSSLKTLFGAVVAEELQLLLKEILAAQSGPVENLTSSRANSNFQT